MFKSSEKPAKEPETWQGPRWEYRARNLKKVAGMVMEADFNKHGAAGWELVAAVDGYALFKRPVTSTGSIPVEERDAALIA